MFAVCVGHSPNNANKTQIGGGGRGAFEFYKWNIDDNPHDFNPLFRLNFLIKFYKLGFKSLS